MSDQRRAELARTVAIDEAEASAPTMTAPEGTPRLPGADAAARLGRGAAGGRFEVETALGRGATGEVWSVRDRSLDRLLAVKILREGLLDDPAGVDGFIAEARLTASLAHPNVLPVHDFDLAEDGRPYFSMSRIVGRALGSLIEVSTPAARGGALANVNAVISIVIAVCNAAAYAHHRGIIHQDIKPDNIMLGDFGEVLLLDWGSAARLGPDGRVSGRLYGTPLYMSPEQARRESADRRSDVYCIGATLFQALTLRLPTWSDAPEAFWEKKRRGEIDQPTRDEARATPAALLAIALKAMAPDPAARYQGADELRADLERFQSGLAVAAYREPWWLRLRRAHRRNARWAWASAAALVLLASAVSFVVAEKLKERGAWRVGDIADPARLGPERLDDAWRLRLRAGWFSEVPFVDAPAAASGHVAIADGGIVLSGLTDIADLSLRQTLRGDLAVEWDCQGLASKNDLNCFIGGVDRSRGFAFHVGGFGENDSCTLTKDEDLLLRRPLPNALGRGPHHFRMERADRHVRLEMDGRPVIDWFDAEDLGGGVGQTFGFDAIIGQRLRIANVRVLQRSLAQRISPLEVGDSLYRLGDWQEASTQYREIISAYPDSELAARSEYRLASCLDKSGAAAAPMALAAYVDFAEHHRDHELAPFALAQAARIARAIGDRAALARARVALTAYRGHPAASVVMRAMSEDVVRSLSGLDSLALRGGGPSAQRELLHWCALLGVDARTDKGVNDIAESMANQGLYDEVLRLPLPSANSRAIVLRETGHFDDALSVDANPGNRCELLIASGRLREAVGVPDAPLDDRMQALYYLGDFAGMRALEPQHQLVEDLDIYEGRAAEYLAAHPTDRFGQAFGMTPCLRALCELGDAERMRRDYAAGVVSWFVLLAEGRPEAIVDDPGASSNAVAYAATWLVGHGRTTEAAAQLPRIAGLDELRALIAISAGDRATARAFVEGWRDAYRNRDRLRSWYVARYALGEIDDAAFLAQPAKLQVESRLVHAKALRAELGGDARAAAERWREFLATPHWQRDLDDWLRDLALARLRAAGVPPPPGPIVPTIGLAYN